jgi:hypothetical protein
MPPMGEIGGQEEKDPNNSNNDVGGIARGILSH